MGGIHITGASGSGTTTLGAALARRLGWAHLDTDDFYWLPSDPPYHAKRPKADRLRLLRHELEAAGDWVLSGALDGWGDSLIPLFGRVIFLFTPTEIRLRRLEQRERQRFGAAKLAPGGCMHMHHQAFLRWAGRYDKGIELGRHLSRHLAWLDCLPCPVQRLDGSLPVDTLVGAVLAAEPASPTPPASPKSLYNLLQINGK